MAAENYLKPSLRLNRDNYYVWTKIVQSELTEKGCWAAVDPGYPEAGEGEDLPQLTPAQAAENNKALAHILKSVDFYYIDDIGECDRAKEAWEILEQINTDFSVLHTLLHLRELVNTKKREGESMQDYISKVQGLVRKCAKGDLSFTDSAIAYFYLLGLPTEKYEVLTRSLELDERNLSAKNVKAKLLLEEKRLQREENRVKIRDLEEDEAKALVSHKYEGNHNSRYGNWRTHNEENNKPRYHQKQSQPTGNYRTSYRPPNHHGESSYAQSKEKRGEWRPAGPTKQSRQPEGCYCCGSMFHRARDCTERFQGKSQPPGNHQPVAKIVSDVTHYHQNDMHQNVESESAVKCENSVRCENAMSCEGAMRKSDEKVIALCANKGELSSCEWFIDSGASYHMCPDASKFEFINEIKSATVKMGDGYKAVVRGMGTVKIKLDEAFGGKTISLSDVLYIPDLDCNLISVGKMTEKGVSLSFEKGAGVCKLNGDSIFTAKKRGDVYLISTIANQNYQPENIFCGISLNVQVEGVARRVATDGKIWHRRLGHLNEADLRKIPHLENVKCSDDLCTICVEAKSVRRGFNHLSESKTERVLELTHSDVMGKFDPPSLGGSQYVVTMLDDFSRYASVKFVKHKDETFDVIDNYRCLNENKHGVKMLYLQSDFGGEYTSKQVEQYLSNHGIHHRKSCPRCPEQNGKAERLNRSLLDMARCMMIESGVPKKFWSEAVNTACFIRNHCPSRSLNYKIPICIWENREISICELENLRVFGCRIWTHIDNASKLDARAEECIFLGYEEGTKGGLRVYSLKRHRVIVRTNGIFEENVFPFKQEYVKEADAIDPVVTDFERLYVRDQSKIASGKPILDKLSTRGLGGPGDCDANKTVEKADKTVCESENPEIEIVYEKVKEPSTMTDVQNVIERITEDSSELTLNDILSLEEYQLSDEGIEVPISQCYNVSYSKDSDIVEPSNVKEAMNGPHKNEWLASMSIEMEQLKGRNVWELVRRPNNANVIGSKWVFKAKRKIDGSIERFKSRLVALGCAQKFGTDYCETFSPVVRRETIRLMIALTCEKGWVTRHLDATTAYLNSDLSELIFMEQPECFAEKDRALFVCKLKKSLYGLKQSGREWFHTVDKMLKDLSLTSSKYDPCLYYDKHKELFVTLYVDDFGVWGCVESVSWFENELGKLIKIRNLGAISCLLNLNIVRVNNDMITVDQHSEIEKLLGEHGLTNCNGSNSPLNVDVYEICQTKEGKEPVDQTKYRRAIGNLLYLANSTRPDLCYAVSFLGQFAQNPMKGHWTGVKHLLRYLKQTKNLRLTFRKSGEPILAYCDSDHAQNKYDRKSFSGSVFLLANCAITWCCRKQESVAMSTLVAEFYAISMCTVELIWICNLIHEIGFESYAPKPALLQVDNNGAICHAKNDTVSKKTKSVSVRFYYVRDEFKKGNISFVHVPSSENLADIFTKSLSPSTNMKFLPQLGLIM